MDGVKRIEPCSQDAATALMRDIVEVCRKHGLWLGHEDDYGAFLVRINSTEEWLMAAHFDRHEVKQ